MRNLLRGACAAAVLALASPASAHFVLETPAAMSVQDPYGSPQKSAPCGLSDSPSVPDQSTPTGMVTTVQAGSTLTISIKETIYHPGHYRVALAQDPASLPPDPPVMAGSTACGSTMIDPAPTLPLLGDGLLVHTSSFGTASKTMQVQIPAGMTCTNCVLQVVQFMSNHALNNPGGCYYHHCARVNVVASAPPADAGTDPGGGGDDGGGDGGASSGGCGVGGAGASSGWLALALGVLLVARRRVTA